MQDNSGRGGGRNGMLLFLSLATLVIGIIIKQAGVVLFSFVLVILAFVLRLDFR